jgi:hypothetical protein
MAARPMLCFLLAVAPCSLARAEDKKLAESKDAPRVLLVSTPSLVRGRTNKLVLRGVNLGQTTAAWVDGSPPPDTPGKVAATQPSTQPATTQSAAITTLAVRITSKAKSDPPKPFEAARAGDSQVELEVDVPPSPGAAEITLVLATANGQAKSPPLLVLDAQDVIDEQEPNNGFREAQGVEFGKTIRGAIQAPGDVDVYRFTGRAGQKVRIEVLAARAGSLLDSTLSLYDARGRLLASNDDSDLGSDSLLVATLPADGVYSASITDANDTGSALHGYQLTLKTQ